VNHQQYVKWDGDGFRKWAAKSRENTINVVNAILVGHKVEQQGYDIQYANSPGNETELFTRLDTRKGILRRAINMERTGFLLTRDTYEITYVHYRLISLK